jgi:hypothetical protein
MQRLLFLSELEVVLHNHIQSRMSLFMSYAAGWAAARHAAP